MRSAAARSGSVTDRLDVALAELATAVDFPPTPPLRGAVAGRLSQPPRRRWFTPLPRALVLALIGLVLLATAAAALVLVPGLRLTLVPSVPTASVPADPLGARLALGTEVGVDEVVGFAPDALGAPDEAYVIGDREIVSLVYAASGGLPELDGTGIGLLVQAIEGALVREQVEKLVPEVGASVTAVTVDGEPGYWITGPSHLLRYLGPNGEERAEATRLVGDSLVWSRDGTLYRIESGLGFTETLRVAESIAP
jgi:hypothetical protein